MVLVFRYILTLVGLSTLFLCGSVLFDLFGIREEVGNYNIYIVWINALLGVVYLIVAFFYHNLKKNTGLILVLLAIVLIMAFIGLRIFNSHREIYKALVFNVLYFRIYLTLILSVMGYILIENRSKTTTGRN